MRWSKSLIPTLKETPGEAEIASHQLMLRAGLIRRLAGGLYSFLPLGLKALRRVEAIVREEMDAAGAQEVLLPAMHPREIWERTGRYEQMKDVMFRVKDRQGRGLVLGPTHEEIITDLVSREISSYRQLPCNFYQIQTKFRDEIRPRFGLMRAKEFIMKDAYSFDVSWDAADASFQAMYDAYVRIFRRCGLRAKVVEADSGDMGGSASNEFMVLADAGEDGLVECSACAYAANLEKATAAAGEPLVFAGAELAPQPVDTPDQRTLAEVSAFLAMPRERFIKTLIYVADGEPVAVLCSGDREVHELKLSRLLGCRELALADEETVVGATGAPQGFAGPVGLALRVVADARLRGGRGLVAGANAADRHLLNVDLERDADVAQYGDLVSAREGDACPRCGAALREKRGIEVGHVFKLGTKYSEAMGATFLNAEGSEQVAVMGCYGIGVTRTLQALIEQSHDGDGIIWPYAVAPMPVEIVLVSVKNDACVALADKLEAQLKTAGIEALVDDRDERPGVKFKDADLLGLPLRVTIGERGLAAGMIEFRERATGERSDIPVEEAFTTVLKRVTQGCDRQSPA